MLKELKSFVKENSLSPFNKQKTSLNLKSETIFKTKDAKSIHTKVLSKLGENFTFSDTSNLWNFFTFSEDPIEIKKRQEFFRQITPIDSKFLKSLKIPKQTWKPKYGIIVVTEDEGTLKDLKNLNCPVQFLNNQYDVESLENYDIVQVIDCENFSQNLEQLPQSVFTDTLDEVYLERYLEQLSCWKENLEILSINQINEDISKLVSELLPLLKLTIDKKNLMLTRGQIEEVLDDINIEIEERLKEMSISGMTLFSMLSKGKMPEEIEKIIENAIQKTGLPEDAFNITIPVSIDEQELEKIIKEQNASEHTSVAEDIKKHSKELKSVPNKLKELEHNLIIFDFLGGLSNTLKEKYYPEISSELLFTESENLFLNNAQPISFHLDEKNKCSILTGANSGGKTTLLEHLIQIITVFQLGLPSNSQIKIPIFTDVYYFAKNKGGTGKGAFENLLTQMDTIKPGKKTIILADEIESVTEPGIAGKIISATAEYFINLGCFMVVATHLGQEIQKNLPNNARIDGIEAKGLNEYYELIVDHNPVLGRLASSTPELIVEKMASSKKTEYFEYLYAKLKSKNQP